jgi:hypothetical protein
LGEKDPPSEKTGSVFGCGRKKISAAGNGFMRVLFSGAAARNKFRVHALGVAHAPSVKIALFFNPVSGNPDRVSGHSSNEIQSKNRNFRVQMPVSIRRSEQAEKSARVLRGDASECIGGEFCIRTLS